jgi:heme exporter protein D
MLLDVVVVVVVKTITDKQSSLDVGNQQRDERRWQKAQVSR